MRRYHPQIIALSTGLAALALLLYLTIGHPVSREYVYPGVMFGALIVFSMAFGVPLGVGFASLTPMVTIAAYLVLGPLPTAWIVFLGAYIHGITRILAQGEQRLNFDDWFNGVSLTSLNAGVHTLALLAAGAVFALADGATPLVRIQPRDFFSLVMLGFIYLGCTYVLIGLYFVVVDQSKRTLFQASLPRLVIFESYPLVFAPLAALIYTRLGTLAFLLFAVAIVISSMITRSLAFARQRLERRVKELGSLQAVGQTLRASLDLEEVLGAIYTQVCELMPADTFLVALNGAPGERLAFPLIFASGERMSNELEQRERDYTQRLLRTLEGGIHPSQLDKDLNIAEPPSFLGSQSWLSVPLQAGDEPLGLIVAGSASPEKVYDQSHQEFLTIIAAQAAIAIQNARLYARTDETLARRVRELNSILNTVGEGVLLVDLSGRILAANPTLVEFLGSPPGMDQIDLNLDFPLGDDNRSILDRIGYTRSNFLEDCRLLNDGMEAQVRARILLAGPPAREVERTLTPVLDRSGEGTGWLFVFRDLAEEKEVERLRDEMMHMLIHDLRAPISTLQGSLELIRDSLTNPAEPDGGKMIALAQKSSERVLSLIEGLLEIHQFEGGRLPLNLEERPVRCMLIDSVQQLDPLTKKAKIRYTVDIEDDLPEIRVDPSHFGRILDNLLDNAYKFTPNGGCVHFSASSHRMNDRVGILIGVSDSGPGIPKQEQAQLFKKFKPVATQLSRRPGTGLGLRYCKIAVEAQGGKIWVESSLNQGSTFYVWFPAVN